MSEFVAKERTIAGMTFTVVGYVLVFLTFFFIIIGFYLTKLPEPVDGVQVKERQEKLAEVRAAAKKETTTYGWVDQPKGVVRIPVDQAMLLTAKELKNK